MIKVENLVKTFGPKRAVDGISFSVERGQVLGFLGPNGAGKSTTMRMITGFIPPTEGKVTVGGHDIVEDAIAAKSLMGYLPENAPAYVDMNVYGFLSFCAEIRGLRGDDRKKAVHRAVETCFLESVLYQSIDTLSKGYRHRTCLAQSIIHDPEVLILDEPTDGLDPNQKHEARNLIRRMGEKKVIIFSTHILEEVEAVCSRAIIIDRGRIVANGTPAELKQRSEIAGAVSVRITGVSADTVKLRLSDAPGAKRAAIIKQDETHVWARVYPKGVNANGALARGVAEVTTREGWKIEELHTEEGRLDEVFRTITLPDTTTDTATAKEEAK
jgi:ABC-2 type transport system ATP-binding protein